MTNILEVKNLTKIFGKKQKAALEMVKQGKSKTEILEKTGATVGVYDASFEIKEGEIFVIMGLSGSGKSTLVRMLNRLIDPSSGNIYLDGKDIAKMNVEDLRNIRRHDINMVFQNFGLFPHRTILENTEFGLEMRGVSKEERTTLAEKALDNAGLLPFKDQYPSQLSGGMQQRVGLARALANSPKILLMDEAFSALDPLIRREMQDELLDLQDTNKQTIIFISHDLNEALRIGDRIALMKDGEIMQIGTGEEILTNPANDFVREFVEDVDRSKVLTAQNIMIKPLTTVLEIDGPQVALTRMHREEVSMLMATNRRRQLLGSLTADAAIEARKKDLPLSEVIDKDVVTVSKDTVITDIMPLIYDSSAPIAVTDDNDRLLGVIIRGRVIEALANVQDETVVESPKETVEA
ncbi:TPA: glycine betaine/L-proline ABC transporter ATP-binding protein [Streptococcus agalactiae]|jgi:glycine betaine/L-proline transport ATP binding subunit|uniref:Quaternary amine transport ATP-binding protein n=4 Tax=Streptococcus agalactiae TaxID=1311 RepID=Q8DXQ3_STRA5|nr:MULTISPECIES: glycine betaine/L-proline ABC transporter ATP-binding protein [Streptococcus]EAO62301.1 amino acid ABC transporter, ATP-binding protein [Streptococcus agalactiae 18RS21]EPX01530.1 glycine/betaine ABC transporter ATP-binding protein [Streptococcus agalactiae MRI Z1-049]HEO8209151.1 glycine betaine/L-proline ABC transporter ATP-binding protein [Streptococcus agalactiae ADL-350]AAN00660.1 amino acid ABC transporter, ATP-binding protein [Streptococcus agalactiae 2603V/R]AKU04303.1